MKHRQITQHNTQQCNRHRSLGAVMSEFVMVLPFLVVVLLLTIYFGDLVTKAQRTEVMTRYEAWREVQNAPGPSSNVGTAHTQLNQTFQRDKADEIGNPVSDNYFPEDAYDELIYNASDAGDLAGDYANALIYRPGQNHRFSRGRREMFTAQFDDLVNRWQRSGSSGDNPNDAPMRRTHVRIGTSWSFSNDWRAGAPDYPDVGGGDPHHLRALRDTFFMNFDADLDAIDRSTSPEYNDDPNGPDNPGDTLAGTIREIYLSRIGYRGPTVNRWQDLNDNN